MIKISVLYPNTAGSWFDHDYYRDVHMPKLKALLGETCLYYTVEKGLAGGPDGQPPYVATCSYFCESMQTFEAAMQLHQATIVADVPNYTDTVPVIQISAVVVEHS